MGKKSIQFMNDDVLTIHNRDEYLRLKAEHKEYGYNRIRASFVCSKCGKPSLKTFRALNDLLICNTCMRSITHTTDEYKERYSQSMIAKYGTTAPLTSPICKEKLKHTMQTRYGVDNAFQYESFKEKSRDTNMRKRGVQYPGQCSECRKKGTDTYVKRTGFTHNMLNPESKARVKNTTLEHFGAIGYASDVLRKKEIETVKRKYGVESYSQTDDFLKKYNATINAHYGCSYPSQSPVVREKMKRTNIERYGHENCMQNIEIRAKSMANRHLRKYTYNNIMFDSTWEISYYIWLTDNNIPFEYHPDISIKYEYDGRQWIYQPDFVVNGVLHEIKGNHFFNSKQHTGDLICPFDHTQDAKCAAKYQCMLENNVKILVYNDIKPYIEYVKHTYGKKFLHQCKRT